MGDGRGLSGWGCACVCWRTLVELGTGAYEQLRRKPVSDVIYSPEAHSRGGHHPWSSLPPFPQALSLSVVVHCSIEHRLTIMIAKFALFSEDLISWPSISIPSDLLIRSAA